MVSLEFDFADEIAAHSAGLADAAEGNLDAPVEGCPGWNVADLVHHLTGVHWFWGAIVGERLAAPPDQTRRPARVERERLIEVFRAGAGRLVATLRAADGESPVWTWAPAQQDVAFVQRHQVQEAAVHHWDAVHAAGRTMAIRAPVAADSIAEFLTFSVSSDADPAVPAHPALDGSFGLRCSDSPAGWTVTDGRSPGTVRVESGVGAGVPALTATASDLLLWLYRRVALDTRPVPPRLIERFRELTFTD